MAARVNWRELWNAHRAADRARVAGKVDGGRSAYRHRVSLGRCGCTHERDAQFAIRSAGHAQWRERGLVSELIADQAVLALLHELAAWPKPGLVSHVDSGSHTDMDAAMLQASAETLRRFFAELARTGQDGADMGRLRTIGLRAEAAMLAVTGGINTHRGAIFGLGLLCAAAGEVC